MLRVHEEGLMRMEEGRATVDAYAAHFLVKCVHIILTSRNPRERVTHIQAVDKWFNFGIGEVQSAREKLREWRRNVHVPIVLKILHRAPTADADEKTVIEVWRLEYDDVPSSPLHGPVSYQDDACNIYKNMIVMTRALYSYLRILPSHRLFRSLENNEQLLFHLEHELVSDTEHNFPLDDVSFQWKEVVSLRTSSGRVSVVVSTNRIDHLLLDLPKAAVTSSVLAQESVASVSGTGGLLQRFQNPVTEHFRTSLGSVRSAVTSLVSQASFKKNFSLPWSQRTTQDTDSKSDVSSEEARIHEFLQLMKGARSLEEEESAAHFSVSYGRELLSMYQQRFEAPQEHS